MSRRQPQPVVASRLPAEPPKLVQLMTLNRKLARLLAISPKHVKGIETVVDILLSEYHGSLNP